MNSTVLVGSQASADRGKPAATIKRARTFQQPILSMSNRMFLLLSSCIPLPDAHLTTILHAWYGLRRQLSLERPGALLTGIKSATLLCARRAFQPRPPAG